jgi:DnaJ-class molecular chaperone
VNHILHVTLEELYSGTTKRMRITRKVLNSSGDTSQVPSEKEIIVKQGWKDGTKITFNNEGDEVPGQLPADIVFTLQTKPHVRFERVEDDLNYACEIPLKDALRGVHTSVLTLDKRLVKIDVPHVTPDTVKIIPGEGMLNSKKQIKGDMRIKFHIIFPDMTDSQRVQISAILD